MHPLVYFIDESIKRRGSTEICALVAIKTIDPKQLRELIDDSVNKVIADPILSQHNGIDHKWAPHYCNDHPFEVHSFFLREIAQLPFEAYIAFGTKERLIGVNEYDWYDHLARVIFSFRFSADKDRSVSIVFEQHDSKVTTRQENLRYLFQKLATKTAQRRKNIARLPSVTSAGKEELILCIPDYIAGCFMAYLCNENKNMIAADRRKYEIVSKKLRWIKDLDSKTIYTSKNPFFRD